MTDRIQKGGFIYVLSNHSHPEFFKIGSTEKDPRDRANQLQTTGVPFPFKVEIAIYSKHHRQIERIVHQKLDRFRAQNNREFFAAPLHTINKLIFDEVERLFHQSQVEQTVSPVETKRTTPFQKSLVLAIESNFVSLEDYGLEVNLDRRVIVEPKFSPVQPLILTNITARRGDGDDGNFYEFEIIGGSLHGGTFEVLFSGEEFHFLAWHVKDNLFETEEKKKFHFDIIPNTTLN